MRALHDVIVVGMGPGGSGAASMLRAPSKFGLVGSELDVLGLELRDAVPSRSNRIVAVNGYDGASFLETADRLLGRGPTTGTVSDYVASIPRIERTGRAVADLVGVEARYNTGVRTVRDLGGGAGVEVELADGVVERARYLIDATGGRLGLFTHGTPEGETIYLTGQVPPRLDTGPQIRGEHRFRVHGAGNDRTTGQVFGFNDVREGATIFVKYPSLPKGHEDARLAKQLLRRHLRDSDMSTRGLQDAAFIRTPHVQVPSAVDGNLIAVGDTVRRVSPEWARGVSNSLADARMAAKSIHAILAESEPVADALDDYAWMARSR